MDLEDKVLERRAKRHDIAWSVALFLVVIGLALVALHATSNDEDPCHEALGFAQRAFMTDSDPGNPIYTANRQLFEESLQDCLK